MQSGVRLGFQGLRNLVNLVGRGQARQVLRQLAPVAEMTGVRGIQQGLRRAAVKAGVMDELTAFPSVVSQQGGNIGLMGTRSVPTARQLGQAPRPAWGPEARVPSVPAGARPTNQLTPQPFQGPRPRGGDIVPTTTPARTAQPARTQFTEDLISQPAVQGPSRAPVQGPSMTGTPVQGQLDLRFPAGARSTTSFTTGRGAVRPEGTAIGGQPYRGGPVASQSNMEVFNPPALQGPALPRVQGPAEARGVQGSFFLDKVPDIWSGGFRLRPELTRQLPREVQERIGTTMMREAADLGSVAPRPAFGPGAGPAPADPIVASAFMRNAAPGAELVDLGSLLSNPAIRAALGATGLGAIGIGAAGMMGDTDRTGEPSGGTPPELPPAPLFMENDGQPLGTAPGAASLDQPGFNPPARGNVDPAAPAPVITSGGLERDSMVREALSQASPEAAAVRRSIEPMSPEKYRSIEEYAAARQAYARAAPEMQSLMRFMEGQSPTAGGGLAAWATQYPAYAQAYQARQQMLKNPAANQQSPETITTRTVTAPIGSSVAPTAVGNAEASADAVTQPSQGAFDMVDVTRPQMQPNLQRVKDFIQSQAPRSAMYAGY